MRSDGLESTIISNRIKEEGLMHTIPLTERAEQTMQALPNSIHAFRLESKLTGG